MLSHLTVAFSTPASDSAKRATPTITINKRKTFANARYSDNGLPNIVISSPFEGLSFGAMLSNDRRLTKLSSVIPQPPSQLRNAWTLAVHQYSDSINPGRNP